MSRTKQLNKYVRKSALSEPQFDCLLDCWTKGVIPERAVEILDKLFGAPKNKQHVLRREGVSKYYQDLGDYLWVVWGYNVCIQLFKCLPDPYRVPDNMDRYPEIDEDIRQLLKLIHNGLTNEEHLTTEANERVLLATRTLISPENETAISAGIFLDQMYKMANGFSIKRMHTYLSRAMALAVFVDPLEYEPNPQERFNQIEKSRLIAKQLMFDSLTKWKLREPFDLAIFEWANDGWSNYQN